MKPCASNIGLRQDQLQQAACLLYWMSKSTFSSHTPDGMTLPESIGVRPDLLQQATLVGLLHGGGVEQLAHRRGARRVRAQHLAPLHRLRAPPGFEEQILGFGRVELSAVGATPIDTGTAWLRVCIVAGLRA